MLNSISLRLRNVALALLVSCGASTGAQADCTDKINEAWWNLLSTRFAFKIATVGPNTSGLRVSGAFQWPSAMRYLTIGPNGSVGQIWIGRRRWRYDGRWHGGKDSKRYSALGALPLYATIFSLRHMPAKNLETITCGQLTERNGHYYLVYSYRQEIQFMGRSIDQDTIFVDARTGFLTRQEIERENPDKPDARKQFQVNTFRADPPPTIEPPEDLGEQ